MARSSGPGWGAYGFVHGMPPARATADDLLTRFRARGGNMRDLLALAEREYPNLGPQEAYVAFMRDAAKKAPKSDLYDSATDLFKGGGRNGMV